MRPIDIYKIANALSDDPDILFEEEKYNLTVTYTNFYEETNNYQIKQAWWGKALRGDPRTFIIQWPNGSLGCLTIEGLAPESFELLKNVAKPHADLIATRRLKKKRMQRLNSRPKWDYMYVTYGRCCPDWYVSTHITGQGDCLQADERGEELAFQAPSTPYIRNLDVVGSYLGGQIVVRRTDDGRLEIIERGAETKIVNNPEEARDALIELDINFGYDSDHMPENYPQGAPVPDAPIDRARQQQQRLRPHPEIQQTYHTDYGLLDITQNMDGSVVLSLVGEEPIKFGNLDDARTYIKDELGLEL